MREFVMRKRDEGKSDLENGKTWEEKCFTNVCDYAQNIDVHHFGGEQTSDTYYYSPLSVYCFGVVDYAQTPEQLTAFLYKEGDGKKGGNNVTSLLHKRMENADYSKYTKEKGPGNEYNLVMDNCGGQKKTGLLLDFRCG